MKLGIMQPYFFPYLGYFDLINYVDKWIVFDTAQYIRHGWINRNRILHPIEGWQYVIVPLRKHSRQAAIKDVKINNDQDWKRRIIAQLQHYRKGAPYFHETMAFVTDCLAAEHDSITQLNVSLLNKVCARLAIPFDHSLFSEMEMDLDPVEGPGDWALRISEAMHAEEYVNPPGGVDLFDEHKFAESNIRLTIRNLPPLEYQCRGFKFLPNLSIIDVLMWNEAETIKLHLDRHQ